MAPTKSESDSNPAVPALVTAPTNVSARPLPSDQYLKESDHYLAWCRLMSATLSRAGGSTLSVATKDVKSSGGANQALWDACDQMGRDLIMLSIHRDVTHLLDGKTTAFEYWSALKGHFAPVDHQSTVRLLTRLFAMRLSSTSVEEVDLFFKEYKEIRLQLSESKSDLSDLQTSAHILSILPDAFESLRTALNVQNDKLPAPDVLIKLVRNECLREESPAANFARSKSTSSTTSKAPTRPCRFCSGPHWDRDCDAPIVLKKREKSAEHRKRQKEKKALAASAASDADFAAAKLSTLLGDEYSTGPQQWHSPLAVSAAGQSDRYEIDSGASHTMTGCRAHFSTFVACAPDRVGGIAGNLFAKGVGTIVFESVSKEGEKQVLKLENCLFVPGISTNLISVSRLHRHGLSTSFGPTALISDKSGKLVATGTLQKNGLYSFNGRVICASNSSIIANRAATIDTWHIRFNHLSSNTIQKRKFQNKVLGLEICDSASESCSGDCNSCRIAKAHRLPFPLSSSRASAPLDLVHADLLEPGAKSLGGRSYGLTIIDDFTRKIWLFPLGRKSDAFSAFKTWLARVENATGSKLKSMRSDNGGEFIGKDFARFLNERGISKNLSVAYTPQQNGRAERPNRDLKERTIALLAESGLPLSFWAEAMLTVVFTKNRAYHESIDDVPERLWRNGSPPDVSFLRAFGCRAWMTIPRQKRRGLEPKGLATVFVGYEPNVKGYRLWDPISKKILVSRDVQFAEHILPQRTTSGGGQLSSAPPTVRPSESEPLVDSVLTHDESMRRNSLPVPAAEVIDLATPPRRPRPVRAPNAVDGVPVRPVSPPPPESPDPIDCLRDVVVPRVPANAEPFSPGSSRSSSPDPLAMPATVELGFGDSHIFSDSEIRAFIASSSQGAGSDDIFSLPSSDPTSWIVARRSAHAQEWAAARDAEIEKLERLRCWNAIDAAAVPADSKLLGSKFVFKSKRDKHGKVVSHRARLVVQGFAQREGVDFNETFAQ